MKTAIEIGNSYLTPALGHPVAAITAHPEAATDILIAYIAKSDPALAEQLAEAVEG